MFILFISQPVKQNHKNTGSRIYSLIYSSKAVFWVLFKVPWSLWSQAQNSVDEVFFFFTLQTFLDLANFSGTDDLHDFFPVSKLHLKSGADAISGTYILPWQYILTYQEYFQLWYWFGRGNRNFIELIQTFHESISTA